MSLLSRRNFTGATGMAAIAGISKSLFPSWMPRMAFRSQERAGKPAGDVLVAIFQRGGMDGLSAVIPYAEGGAYYDIRPTIGIKAPDGTDKSAIDLNGQFGLHPALRGLKDVYDAGHLAVLHAIGSPDPTRSHFEAMEFMERGTPGDRMTGAGWINRHLQSAAWQNNSPFRAIGMGAMLQSSLQGPAAALALKSIADFHLRGRDDQIALMERTLGNLYSIQAPKEGLQQQAAELFSSIDLLDKLTIDEYQPANGADYGYSDFGNGLKQIAQLIKADVGLEIACVDIGGWDTHEGQGAAEYGSFQGAISELGQGLTAFYADLRDYMNGVTVVTMSEFGRRVEENTSGGTDHGHGNAMFVLGGGINGGVYSRWPGLAPANLDDGDLAITTDYRDALAEIVISRMLNPALDQVFPNYTPKPIGLARQRT